MTIFRIDADALIADAKKATADDPELQTLISNASGNFQAYSKWADKMEKERKFGLSVTKQMKNSVRDFYRELDKKITDKATDPKKVKTLKDLRKEANSLWIKLDTVQKAFMR